MVRIHPPKLKYVDQDIPGLVTWLVPGNWKEYPPSSVERRRIHYVDGNLAISQGNPVSQLGKTRDAIGGDFQVYRKKLTEYSSLGSEPRHFSPSEDPMADGNEHWYAQQNALVHNVAPEGWYWPVVEPSSMFTLDALGTTAISRILPTKSAFNSAAFLGELREGIPKAGFQTWQKRTLSAKNAGGDYLNAQFGWIPLVNDVRKFARAVKNAESILDRYERESGKLLHRQYEYPVEDDTEVFHEYGDFFPHPRLIDAIDLDNHNGVLKTTVRTYRKCWVEAAFVYVLPPKGSNARKAALADKLMGWQITPEVLWQLAPWSWAADWVSNTGDIAANLSAFMFDGLVMPYAYIMEHKRVVHERQLSGVHYKCYPGSHVFRQTFTHEVKTRRVATPFGFGLNVETFTPRQMAILAALGASRGKR